MALLAFKDAHQRALMSPEDLLPHITLIAWRITREIGRVRGILIADKETLTGLHKERWTITDAQRGKREPPPADNPIEHAERLAWSLPLAYSPGPSWTYLAEFTASYLAVSTQGSHRAALNLLLEDPAQHWPSPAALADFDETFIQATARRLLRQSRPKISQSLQKNFALLPHEANNLCLLATRTYAYLGDEDTAAAKGLMVAKLEDFAHRMREALNPREEMQALKQICTVQGLTKPEKAEAEEDLADVIARVAQEDDIPRIE